jgi:hypothetical protein
MNISEPLVDGGKTSGAMLATPLGIPMMAIEKGMALKSNFNNQQGSADTYQQTRQAFRDAFGSSEFSRILGETLQKQGQVPNAPEFRYAKPNEPATMMDGERVVRILQSIDQRLAPQP